MRLYNITLESFFQQRKFLKSKLYINIQKKKIIKIKKIKMY